MSAVLRRTAPLLLALVVLAACARAGGAGSSAVSSAAASGSPAAGSTGMMAAVAVAHTSAGDALTGPDGRTLYVFTKDTASTIACTGTCATNWPPFVLGAGETASAGSGVTAGWLGTVQRPDGTTQVTYNGRPLYEFKGDSAAGDANGQGVSGLWFIASPDGTIPAASPAPAASAAASSSGYGYTYSR